MFPVEFIMDLVLRRSTSPQRGAGSRCRLSAAAAEYLARLTCDAADNQAKPLTDSSRGLRGGLLDIDLPVDVEPIGHVDLNACELGKLALLRQPEPSAVDNQSSRAIKIKTLASGITEFAAVFLPIAH